MFWTELILIVVIIILLYFLFKKNIKPENTAPVVNKTNKDDLGKRVIIEELEDQFFALDKYNLIKYLNKSAKQRFGENLIDKNIVRHNLTLYREIDCWELFVDWTPNGYAKGLYFRLNLKSDILRDLKIEQKTGIYTTRSSF